MCIRDRVKRYAKAMKNERDQTEYMHLAAKYKLAVTHEETEQGALKLAEKQKAAVDKEISTEKAKFEAEKKVRLEAHKSASEKHKKSVVGRQSRNCNKLCKMYRLATDSESTPEQSNGVKKGVCFAEPQKTKQEKKEQKAEKKAEKQQAKIEQKTGESKGKTGVEPPSEKQESKPTPARLLGEGDETACQGMTCKCTVYAKWTGDNR
eukprot:TRINITY_DN9857_c0_g1_i2.p1 TRINITY_DN9857_c0_g1~~TRINITY_DN9857_c0_g1_i2.p1  ORF type:complete len:207 (+),score=83.85 TRINITY_DN9857_c0_g1_i2:124-744(+)